MNETVVLVTPSVRLAEAPSLTVVIPTLGGEQLLDTIAQLNNGSVRPQEILVCVPAGYADRIRVMSHDNVKVLVTECKGQVNQRAEGFRNSACECVMQLDDDIYLEYDTLEKMVLAISRLGSGNVVGPVYYNAISGLPLTEYRIGFIGLVFNAYELIVRGLPWGKKRMGALSSIGACGGVDPRYCADEVLSTEWLPGGCVLSRRDNLLTDRFFPLSGKAFSEDVLHSYLRTKTGIRHHVVCSAKAIIQPPDRSVSPVSARAEISARLYVASVLGGGRVRAYIAAVLDILRRQVVRLLPKVFL